MPWRLLAVAWLYEAGSWFGFLSVVSWLEATGGPAWAGAYFVLYNGVQLPAAAALGPRLDRLERGRGLLLAVLFPLLALVLALAVRALWAGLVLGAAFAVADYLLYTLVPAAVPLAVPAGKASRANALWQTGSGVLFVLAPAVAGVWIGRAGVFAGFAAAGILAALAGGLALGLRLGRPEAAGEGAGWRAVLAYPLVGWTAVSLFLVSAGGGVANAALPGLTGGGRDYGLVLSALGAGGLAAALVLLGRSLARPLWLAALGALLHFAGNLGLALGGGLGSLMAAGFLKGAANSAYHVGLDTAFQTGLPGGVLARAFSLGWAVANLGQVAGAGAYGLLGGKVPARGLLLGAAVLAGIALLPLKRAAAAGLPRRGRRDGG